MFNPRSVRVKVLGEKEAKEQFQLFDKWGTEGIEVKDLGLRRYVSLKPFFVLHSMGRHAHGKFRKADVNIVERFVNQIMRPGRNAGKKVRAMNVVRNAFEIIYLRTGLNPAEVLVRAVENSAPCEDTTRISFGGVVYHLAVDISPQRRVDLALRSLSDGARKEAFGNPRTLEECLAEELILAANGDTKSFAIQRRNEMERVALSSR